MPFGQHEGYNISKSGLFLLKVKFQKHLLSTYSKSLELCPYYSTEFLPPDQICILNPLRITDVHTERLSFLVMRLVRGGAGTETQIFLTLKPRLFQLYHITTLS